MSDLTQVDYPLERRVPTHLQEEYPAALQAMTASHTPLTDPDWTDSVQRRLEQHAAAIVAEHFYGGQRPDQAPARGGRRTLGLSSTPGDGRPPMEWQNAPDEKRLALGDQRAEFLARVTDLAEAIRMDPARQWALFLHFLALDMAERRRQQREERGQRELERIAREECPLCKQHDPTVIGEISTRSLLPGQGFVSMSSRPARHTLRSCLACHAVASREHVFRLGEVTLGDGKTRAQMLYELLSEGAH
ncbi:hypothetical protein [uncultured Microbacterium sp.]|nr:hypothetical protein [uncultured Microbacterium sp.]